MLITGKPMTSLAGQRSNETRGKHPKEKLDGANRKLVESSSNTVSNFPDLRSKTSTVNTLLSLEKLKIFSSSSIRQTLSGVFEKEPTTSKSSFSPSPEPVWSGLNLKRNSGTSRLCLQKLGRDLWRNDHLSEMPRVGFFQRVWKCTTAVRAAAARHHNSCWMKGSGLSVIQFMKLSSWRNMVEEIKRTRNETFLNQWNCLVKHTNNLLQAPFRCCKKEKKKEITWIVTRTSLFFHTRNRSSVLLGKLPLLWKTSHYWSRQ